jgi:long-subunit acyl-CoA synthetase (AMP-forming)
VNLATPHPTIDQALTRPSLPSAFLLRAEADPDTVALRAYGSAERLTLGGWSARARAFAGGLAGLGIGRGETVGLLLTSRIEFHIADLGALLLGAVPFSLYATSPVNQLREIVENARPRVLVVEASLADKARELRAAYPALEHLVVVEPEAVRSGEIGLADLEAGCPDDFDVHATSAASRPDDICTLVYTSGTTGPPKGVQFRHGAMLACLDSIRRRFDTSERDRAISYLPMAHIAERVFGHYAAFVYGYEVTSLGDPSRLAEALRAVRPTRFFGVPRIYEKLLAGLHRAITESDDRERLRAALAIRLAHVRAEQERFRAGGGADKGAAEPGQDTDDRAGDDREAAELLRPYAEMTGLDQARFLAVAGAPSSPAMLEEVTAFGLPINEFYGSSETIIITSSPPERIRLGTAGTPLPGVRLRLDSDGEVLVAGPTVTPGYLRDPERTAESLDADGWFHTGDVGELDRDGYLRIVDRKKALIINSAGKNMSSANIEQAIKGGQPLIAQAFAIGDRRPYNVALVVLDRDGVAGFAREHELGEQTFEQLTRHPAVLDAVARAVERGNQRLARVEQIKRHTVLDHDWPLGSAYLTPTAKLKRREIDMHYRDAIEALYA